MDRGSDDWTFVEVCKTKFDDVVLRKYYNSPLYDSEDVGENIRYVITALLILHEGDRKKGKEVRNMGEYID